MRHSLTHSTPKAQKPALPTVTNSSKAEIPACRSLIYSHITEILAWKFRTKTVTSNVVSGDRMLWELTGESESVKNVHCFIS